MVDKIRETEKSIGKVDYNPTSKQIEGRQFSRSLYIVENISKGEIFTEKNIRSIRPGYGMHPKFLKNILGKNATSNLEKGTPLKEKNIL